MYHEDPIDEDVPIANMFEIIKNGDEIIVREKECHKPKQVKFKKEIEIQPITTKIEKETFVPFCSKCYIF